MSQEKPKPGIKIKTAIVLVAGFVVLAIVFYPKKREVVMSPPTGVEGLIIELSIGDSFKQAAAARKLGEMGNPVAVDPLIQALTSPYDKVKEAAAEALGKIGGTRAVDALITALKEYDWEVKNSAAIALARIGDQRSVAVLIEALGKESPIFVRLAAAEAFGESGHPEAVDPLIAVFKEDDVNLKNLAAKALAKIGDKNAIDALLDALKSDSEDERKITVEALSFSRETRVITALISILKEDSDRDVRRIAATSLGRIGDNRALGALIESLNDTDSGVQANVINALAVLGNPQAGSEIAPFLRNWELGQTTASALEELGWKPESITDQVHLWVVRRDGEKLKERWEDVRGVLLEDIASGNSKAMENALYIFIRIGREDIIPEMIEILQKKGTPETANAYLQCGQKELRAAAVNWGKKHGYYVTESFPGMMSAPVTWGGL